MIKVQKLTTKAEPTLHVKSSTSRIILWDISSNVLLYLKDKTTGFFVNVIKTLREDKLF